MTRCQWLQQNTHCCKAIFVLQTSTSEQEASWREEIRILGGNEVFGFWCKLFSLCVYMCVFMYIESICVWVCMHLHVVARGQHPVSFHTLFFWDSISQWLGACHDWKADVHVSPRDLPVCAFPTFQLQVPCPAPGIFFFLIQVLEIKLLRVQWNHWTRPLCGWKETFIWEIQLAETVWSGRQRKQQMMERALAVLWEQAVVGGSL